MIYADDTFYTDKYLLGREPVISAGFTFYARSASQIMDQYTFGRLESLAEIPEAARMCCCELAETGYNRERQRREAGGKTAERLGTYSVSFSGAQEAAESAAKEQRSIVLKWLADIGLCYQGVE